MSTLREWIAIHKDLDAYIANGGQLSELEMFSPDQFPDAVLKRIAEEIGGRQIERLGRFNQAVAAMVSNTAHVGDVLSEEELRSIWRETADDLEKLAEKIKNSITRRDV